jgi:hypothetical protein
MLKLITDPQRGLYLFNIGLFRNVTEGTIHGSECLVREYFMFDALDQNLVYIYDRSHIHYRRVRCGRGQLLPEITPLAKKMIFQLTLVRV